MPARLLLATVATALLAGCTVGPDFQRPATPADTGYLAPSEVQRTRPGGPVAAPGD